MNVNSDLNVYTEGETISWIIGAYSLRCSCKPAITKLARLHRACTPTVNESGNHTLLRCPI